MKLAAVGGPVVVLSVVMAGVLANATGLPTAERPRPVSDPVVTVQTLEAALNAHEIDAAMAFFTDTATVQDASRHPQDGEQIRGWLSQLMRQNLRIELRGRPVVGSGAAWHLVGESVTWPATLSLTHAEGSGTQHIDAVIQVVVDAGRVSFLSLRPVEAAEVDPS